jgi:transcription elongation factor Elf1
MPKYFYCRYCGIKNSSIAGLTASSCIKHPLGPNKGKHAVYEGSEKARYTCKYCGFKASSIAALTTSFCRRHPNGTNKGRHEPAL